MKRAAVPALVSLAIGVVAAPAPARAEDEPKPPPADKAPADKAPADKAPADKAPADKAPGDQTGQGADAAAKDTVRTPDKPAGDPTAGGDPDAKAGADAKAADGAAKLGVRVPGKAGAGAGAAKAGAAKTEDGKPVSDEEEGEPRLSLPTEADRVAWRRSGFRLGLAGAYGHLAGLRGAPSGRLIAAKLHVGLRLDEQWSVTASFEYARASQTGGLSGLRFAGTLDPTWHVTPSVSVALGFGFGGIVEGFNTGRPDAEPLAAELETSYTFPDASPPIARCSGVGAAGLARVEWSYVLGPRSRFTLAAEATGQWTGCVHDTNRFEPDTGEAIVRRQWWPHAGVTIAGGMSWR